MILNLNVKKDLMADRRNRLAYLALYYAIQGDDDRSEKIRKLVKNLGTGGSDEKD